jgi:hypothetical protein
MELPRGLIFEGCHRDTHCLKLLKNLYGQKQAGRVWHEYLVEGLIERHFKQSVMDNCVFYKGSTMLLVYVDDAIIYGPSSKVIDKIVFFGAIVGVVDFRFGWSTIISSLH